MRRKGFTLVELLIVVAIIAALAVMMMMSNTSAVADAEVSAIMGNLRSLKTAALSEYFRDKDTYDTKNTETSNTEDPVLSLIFAQLGTKTMKGYTVSADASDSSIWYAIYNGKSTLEVARKIYDKADIMGLLLISNSTNGTGKVTSSDYTNDKVEANQVVGIRIK